jgi:hypothetical protein
MVGYCTDSHVRRGGNMVYINCEVLTLLYCKYLLFEYSSNLPRCEVKLRIDWKFWNIFSSGQRF